MLNALTEYRELILMACGGMAALLVAAVVAGGLAGAWRKAIRRGILSVVVLSLGLAILPSAAHAMQVTFLSESRAHEIAKGRIEERQAENYETIAECFRYEAVLPLAWEFSDYDIVICADPEWDSLKFWDVKKVQAGSDGKIHTSNLCETFYSRLEETYLISRDSGLSVAGLFNRGENAKQDGLFCWAEQKLYEPIVSNDGTVRLNVTTNGFEELFSDQSVCEVVAPWVRSYSVPQGNELPSLNPAHDLKFIDADSISKERLVAKCRENVKAMLTANVPVTIYAVFADADNDGECDAYVTSDRARFTNGRYRWHLYLQKKGIWLRCEKALDLTPSHWSEHITVEERVDAAPTDFFYVYRQGLPPTILPTQCVENRISACSYLRHTSAERRADRNRPEGIVSISAIENLGEPYHRDFSDLFEGLSRLQKITRLRCETFPDPKTTDGKGRGNEQ